ncbi:MAG TPA: cytochrome P450 [Myxococcaceae bacterium]|nr:cytochrome P450 [Myxococcaceae bacterium]
MTAPHAAAGAVPGPPTLRSTWPGQLLLRMQRDPLGFFERARDAHGDAVRFRFGPETVYLLSHPDLVRDVLLTRSQSFHKGLGLERAKILLGEGLLTSEGAFHLRQRRLMQPAFHRTRIAAYAEAMVDAGQAAAGRWVDGAELDIPAEMARLTLAVVAKTLFDADVEGTAAEVGRALTDTLGLFGALSLPFGELVLRLPLPAVRRFRRGRARLDAEVARILAERRATGGDRGDLLSMLLAARDEDGQPMTDAQLRDEVMTLFLAGHETTANALAWTFHLLGQNPEAEEALHAELDGVLGGRRPSAEDVGRLPVTSAVFAEALRLYPPAWVLGRRAQEPVLLGDGVELPRGALAVLSPFVVHRDPRWFPRPLEMQLDRWTPEARAARHRFAYFPFGAGTRSCIGEAFAWTEGTLLLAVLAGSWRLRPLAGSRVRPEPRITLRPRGLRMWASRRSSPR